MARLLFLIFVYNVVIQLQLLNQNVDAFSFSSSSSSSSLTHPLKQQQHQQKVLPTTIRKKSNLFVIRNRESLMTSQDEEVLFGQSTTTIEKGAVLPPSSQHTNSMVSSSSLSSSNNQKYTNYKSDDPVTKQLINMRFNKLISNVPSIWSELTKIVPPDSIALIDEHTNPKNKISLTFAEANASVQRSAAFFQQVLNIKEKEAKVAIFGENSAYWILIDHGIQLAGGVSAVRGADAPIDELKYIYDHSDSYQSVVLQGPKLLKKLVQYAKNNDPSSSSSKIGLSNQFGNVKNVVFMHREKVSNEDIQSLETELDITIHVFEDILNESNNLTFNPVDISPNDLSTIVYTSGTTGNPKGVMLTHSNLLHQIKNVRNSDYDLPTYGDAEPLPNEIFLSLLPVWHITERAFELVFLTRGCTVVYSSIRHFKGDLAKHRPQWLVLVPRVLEKVASGVQNKFAAGSPIVQKLVQLFTSIANSKTKYNKISNGFVLQEKDTSMTSKLSSKLALTILSPLNSIGDKIVWSKVKDGFGGRVKYILSGGSALSGVLESFYESAGIPILVGYGLTECSPLISNRKSDSNFVTPGCVGRPLMDTEIRVVDPDDKVGSIEARKSLPDGQPGLVLVKGPQVMKGYYKNPESTSKAIDIFGYFDTGDLGRFNPQTGDLILTGRAKDTIVLSNGENIEPSPIEDAILSECSPYIDQVMLTGQDGRYLTAICVLNPMELYNNEDITSISFSKQDATKLQKEIDIINDPKWSIDACETSSEIVKESNGKYLHNNEDLYDDLLQNVRMATGDNPKFQKWEQVQKIIMTFEPFAMSNGLLTQSYKVKRDKVFSRYEELLS